MTEVGWWYTGLFFVIIITFYAIGFFYPVVPKGEARIRTQISAAHEKKHLDIAIAAFIKVGKELNVIN